MKRRNLLEAIWTFPIRIFRFLFGWLLPAEKREEAEAKRLIEKAAKSINGFDEIHDMTWVMFQSWQSVLFMHWPISMEKLKPLVPEGLTIDTFEGSPWISLLPMHMVNLHLNDMPPVPGTSNFPEINLRTYVTVNGRPGVYFFSIDARTYLGSWIAKSLFHLPYLHADMKLKKKGNTYHMKSTRSASIHHSAAAFEATFEPVGEPKKAESGSLEYFLAERYSAFSVNHKGRLFRGDLVHKPWEIQDVKASIRTNTMLVAAGLDVGDTAPQLHFSPGTDSFMWPVLPID